MITPSPIIFYFGEYDTAGTRRLRLTVASNRRTNRLV